MHILSRFRVTHFKFVHGWCLAIFSQHCVPLFPLEGEASPQSQTHGNTCVTWSPQTKCIVEASMNIASLTGNSNFYLHYGPQLRTLRFLPASCKNLMSPEAIAWHDDCINALQPEVQNTRLRSSTFCTYKMVLNLEDW